MTRLEVLKERNEVLRKRISQLEKLNKEMFEKMHKAEERVMHLEEENAFLRSQDSE